MGGGLSVPNRALANAAASHHQMWNSVGIVRSYDDEQDNAIDVEFHDTAVHHAMHLTNSLGHTVADVSQEAVLLACPATDELARWEKHAGSVLAPEEII